jgi:PAS domain S-box-containing protein
VSLEEELAQSKENEETMRLALDAASEFLWDGDLRTGKIAGSPQAAKWLGYEPHEWPPTPWNLIVHEDDRERVDQEIKRAVIGETRTYRVRHRLRTKAGAVLHVMSTGAVIREPGGRAIRFVGFVRDMTQEVEEEAHRVQAQKLESLGLLAGGIAHDFNNLLTAVSASLDLAARAGLPADAARSIATATEAVQRATALTRQLLAYAGRAPLAHGPVAINELVTAMSDLLAVSIPKSVRLERELCVEPAAVLGDASQLQQVVLNLVTNAAEATGGAAGTVTVRTEAEGKRVVRLIVSDTGHGITPEEQLRIFDPFFSTKGSGRGLGLAVVSRIVKSHGGTIRVQPGAAGGTRFIVELPATEAPKAAAQPGTGASAKRFKLRVLVVDDEKLIRTVARKVLERLGCEVEDVELGTTAVERVRETPTAWDLVLMDVMMPELSGTEAAAQIRAIAPSLPIVLSSGYSTEAPTTQERVYFIAKPYTLTEVEELLVKLFPATAGTQAAQASTRSDIGATS